MKTITIPMASPLRGDLPQQVTIVTEGEVPTFNTSEDYRLYYRLQAQVLVDALKNALPQGMLEQVMLVLLEQKASLYRGIAGP